MRLAPFSHNVQQLLLTHAYVLRRQQRHHVCLVQSGGQAGHTLSLERLPYRQQEQPLFKEEKSTLQGVIIGASAPRGSPRGSCVHFRGARCCVGVRYRCTVQLWLRIGHSVGQHRIQSKVKPKALAPACIPLPEDPCRYCQQTTHMRQAAHNPRWW